MWSGGSVHFHMPCNNKRGISQIIKHNSVWGPNENRKGNVSSTHSGALGAEESISPETHLFIFNRRQQYEDILSRFSSFVLGTYDLQITSRLFPFDKMEDVFHTKLNRYSQYSQYQLNELINFLLYISSIIIIELAILCDIVNALSSLIYTMLMHQYATHHIRLVKAKRRLKFILTLMLCLNVIWAGMR